MMRSRWFALTISTILLLAAGASAAYRIVAPGVAMTTAANQWLGSLSDDQKKIGLLEYDAPVRVDWHFIPKATRKGVQYRDMNEAQRKAALALLRSTVSEIGYHKATSIMGLEVLLKDLEKSKTGTPLRDSERYYFTIFGKPTESSKWGLSIEGHHMSLNFVVEGGKVISSTPQMFGANPAIVKNSTVESVKTGTELLAKEERLALELLHALDADQRKVAVIADKALDEVRNAGAPQPPADAPVGLVASKMTDAQKKILRALVDAYAAGMPEEVARQRWEAIESTGFDKLHFAWAGGDQLGQGHYYRIQGDTFAIEFVNTQPDAAGNPANHIHCMWRDQRGDFALPIK
jgi:hypothetical protein